MRKTIILFLIAFTATAVLAQSPLPPPVATHQCDIVITGDFDSECIYDYKDEITDEYPNLMIACKGSTVTYTAYADMGTATPAAYIWTIYGDVTHTATGNSVVVEWGNDEWGYVVVSVVGDNNDTCTGSSRVKLIDNPVVGATTVPSYTVLPSGDKIIRVCEGGTVEFMDNSSSGNSDISGYLWKYNHTRSSTPNFTLENVMYDGKVYHRVYNNCGCYDEELYFIEVVSGADLEIDCYGTVCKDAIVTYTATSPTCTDYQWYVDGGTIIRGQGTATPTVQWDNPTDGYGVIGLDGYQCGETVCPRLMSRKVPVIHGGIAIKGQAEACVGEAVVYSLPLFGSTEYQWDIAPLAGVDTSMKTHSNETRFVFTQDGTYTLTCRYRCDFLDCGPYQADTLTITVKPKLDIVGADQICITNACYLETSPVVSATWTAYDLGNNNAVAATATGTTFSHTFSHKGRYLITAAHPDYCTEATFVLEVKDTPPAPTVTDLDPHNRHTACYYGSIALSGTPSEPNYNLVWHPACTTASPQWYSGDSVTMSYQDVVCDVHVYNYDRVLQCRSSNYYIHQMTALAPAPLNFPQNITVCPETIITWDNSNVPDQSSEGVLYEWSIEENKQYCASVYGSQFSSGVTLIINNITPTTFYVKLRRTICGIHLDTMIYINVVGASQTAATISGDDEVCVHESATYTGSGNNPNTYIWNIEGLRYNGVSVNHTFHHEGTQSVVLYSSSHTYCRNTNYMTSSTMNVVVHHLPMVQGLEYDQTTQTINVVPALAAPAYSFTWWLVQTVDSWPQYLNYTGNSIPAPSTPNMIGTYFCMVTDNSTGCSKTVGLLLPHTTNEIEPECENLTITGSYSYCTNTLNVSTRDDLNNIQWSLSGGPGQIIEQYSPHNYMADIRLDDIGIYTVKAYTFSHLDCYEGTYVHTVDFIPDFTVVAECDRIRIVNNSRYLGSGQTVYLRIMDDCNQSSTLVQMHVSTPSYTFIPNPTPMGSCTYTVRLVGYGAIGNISPACTLGSATIGTPPLLPRETSQLTIRSANNGNEHNTCNNTPIRLTAHLGYPGSIQSSLWLFGDNSSFNVVGDHVDHTFGYPGYYNVNVAITDNYGCVKNATFSIVSNNNPFSNPELQIYDPEVCPYFNNRDIGFSPNYSDNTYSWWRLKDPTRIPTNNTNTYSTYQTDDYFVYVINNNYCQKEASKNVTFLNAPTASIYAENFNCCAGNSISLYGEQGASNSNLTYSWSITGPNGFSETYTTPNVTFTAPAVTGTYNVTLTVTDVNTTCSSTATETITVNAKPAAPTLAFSGSPCISDAPVTIAASGFTGEMHWSNGLTGSTSDFYTHGMVSGYYYDPTIGCASDTATIRIHKQPDFDALLTGCYKKCYDFFDYYLPVWGLTDDSQDITWRWSFNGNTLSGGTDNYTYSPLMLPLQGFGRYQLQVYYSNGNCSELSPELTIGGKELCDCDSISVSYTLDTLIKDCHLSYTAHVTICNNRSDMSLCLGKLEIILKDTNVSITDNYFTPTTIAPGNCYTFDMTINVRSLMPSVATFRIVDMNCGACEKMFSIDIMPDTSCLSPMVLEDITIDEHLTSSAAGYFTFKCDVSYAESVLAFWSEPPMVIDYLYDGNDLVTGLGMMDPDLLSQLIYNGDDICFYAITCFKDIICKRRLCIPAYQLRDMIKSRLTGQDKGPRGGSENGETGAVEPGLKPNPTSGEVCVTGVQGDVTEIVVMDMAGRHLATFTNTAEFNIATLATGSYIVRVMAVGKDGQASVTYHKLIKE